AAFFGSLLLRDFALPVILFRARRRPRQRDREVFVPRVHGLELPAARVPVETGVRVEGTPKRMDEMQVAGRRPGDDVRRDRSVPQYGLPLVDLDGFEDQ